MPFSPLWGAYKGRFFGTSLSFTATGALDGRQMAPLRPPMGGTRPKASPFGGLRGPFRAQHIKTRSMTVADKKSTPISPFGAS